METWNILGNMSLVLYQGGSRDFFYNLVILIKQCKIPYKNLDKALLFWRNQVLCLKNWKLWWAPTTIDFNNFCWNFTHVSYLPVSTKECSRFFKFCLEVELFAKTKKDLISTHSQKPGLSITQDLNKIKKIPNTHL